MVWQRVEFEDRHVGEELDIGEARNVRHHRTSTDVEEDPVGLQELFVNPQRVWILEAGVTANDGAAVHAFQPAFDTFAVLRA